MKALEKQLAAKSGDLLQFSAKYVELTDELGPSKSQRATGNSVSEDLKSIVVPCERPVKRARVTR